MRGFVVASCFCFANVTYGENNGIFDFMHDFDHVVDDSEDNKKNIESKCFESLNSLELQNVSSWSEGLLEEIRHKAVENVKMNFCKGTLSTETLAKLFPENFGTRNFDYKTYNLMLKHALTTNPPYPVVLSGYVGLLKLVKDILRRTLWYWKEKIFCEEQYHYIIKNIKWQTMLRPRGWIANVQKKICNDPEYLIEQFPWTDTDTESDDYESAIKNSVRQFKGELEFIDSPLEGFPSYKVGDEAGLEAFVKGVVEKAFKIYITEEAHSVISNKDEARSLLQTLRRLVQGHETENGHINNNRINESNISDSNEGHETENNNGINESTDSDSNEGPETENGRNNNNRISESNDSDSNERHETENGHNNNNGISESNDSDSNEGHETENGHNSNNNGISESNDSDSNEGPETEIGHNNKNGINESKISDSNEGHETDNGRSNNNGINESNEGIHEVTSEDTTTSWIYFYWKYIVLVVGVILSLVGAFFAYRKCNSSNEDYEDSDEEHLLDSESDFEQ